MIAVSWNWGSGAPGGTVAETKKEGEIAITSKRGNKIKKNAEPSNPAVHVERSGNDVVKKASELNIEEKANGNTGGDSKDADSEAKNGDKRKHDEVDKEGDKAAEEKKDEPLEENAEGKTIKAKEPAAKKQKKEPAKKDAAPAKGKKEPAASKEAPAESKPAEKKKAGRPAKGTASGTTKKQKKEPTPRSGEGIGSRTRSRG